VVRACGVNGLVIIRHSHAFATLEACSLTSGQLNSLVSQPLTKGLLLIVTEHGAASCYATLYARSEDLSSCLPG
jgi:hypothetical protein